MVTKIVILGSEYRNFDCLKFCCAVSCFKMICKSGDQPEYPLSIAVLRNIVRFLSHAAELDGSLLRIIVF